MEKFVYTVKEGDTLHSIAKALGVSEAALSEKNNTKNIHPGLKLFVDKTASRGEHVIIIRFKV